MKEHKFCRYRFFKWLIVQAVKDKKLYWLLWGIILALCFAGSRMADLL